MIDKVSLLTDNFFKFLTSLSLLAFIYCSSFDTLFLAPHNKIMYDNNLEMAKLSADYNYLDGISYSLKINLDSLLKKGIVKKYLADRKYDVESVFYYTDSTNDINDKLFVDSLNIINKRKTEISLKLDSTINASLVYKKNIRLKKWIMFSLSIIALFSFSFGLIRWYQLRDKIDK